MSTTTAATTAVATNKVILTDVRVGDVFSEESHYVYQGQSGKNYQFKHLESGNVINLDEKYVTELLQTADQYTSEVEVGREDKYWTAKQIEDAKKKGEIPSDSNVREGDIRVAGIRSIWAGIHSGKVFTVSFNKQAKELSAKALNEARNKQLQEALVEISNAATAKKGVAKTAEDVIKKIQENPVLPTEPGEERKLRGYKVQFTSLNGLYDVVDMDIQDNGKNSNLRKVNINEINWLVIGGVKYTVK
jgi:hypothetical protein